MQEARHRFNETRGKIEGTAIDHCFKEGISRVNKTKNMLLDYMNSESCGQDKVLKCHSNECVVKSVTPNSKLRQLINEEATWDKTLEENKTEAMIIVKKEVR